MIKINRTMRTLIDISAAGWTTAALYFYYGFSLSTLFFCLVFAAVFLLLRYANKLSSEDSPVSKHAGRALVAVAVLFALALVLGKHMMLHIREPFLMMDVLKNIFVWIGMSIFILALCNIGLHFLKLYTPEKRDKPSNRRMLLIFWIVLFACFLPYLFLFFPGYMTYDSVSQYLQASYQEPLVNAHPVTHTLLIRVCYWLSGLFNGGQTGTTLIYSIIQMAAMSFIFAACLYFFYNRGARTWMVGGFIFYYGVASMHPMYSVTMWKDVLFGGVMLLYVLLLYKTAETKGESLRSWSGAAQLYAVTLSIALLRVNGIYLLIPTSVILLIYLRFRIKAMAAVLSAITLFYCIQGPLFNALQIKNNLLSDGPHAMVMQVARAVTEGKELTESERQVLEQMMPLDTLRRSYNPMSVDFIKCSVFYNGLYMSDHNREFMQVWLSMLGRYPQTYIEAYMCLVAGYWYPDIYSQYDKATEQYNLTMVNILDEDAVLHTQGPDTKDAVSKTLVSLPVVSSVFSLGFQFWFILFTAAVAIRNGNKRFILALTPLLTLWLTLMISSPVYNEMRYMYSFFTALPVTVMILTQKKEKPLT